MSVTHRVRRSLAVVASAGLVAGLTAVGLHLATGTAVAQATDPYQWNNVEIVGGGFVPNIIFNESEPNLIYARTDIGGAYRWNQSTQRWIPLTDWVGWDNWGRLGVDGLATDPVNPNRLYLAVGMYTNDWDPNNGAVLRSSNRGQTFDVQFNLPFKLGGNMLGRGMGERIKVDPNNNNVVYLGAPNGNGLWRSTNAGQSFSRVTSFPNPGNWSQQPGDVYLGHQPGVVWVTFDPRTGSPGSTTQTIYVGVADLNNTVYRSTNGGSTWQRVPDQPTGFMAQKGELDPVNGYLYIATSDNAGPYDGTDGEVWRLNTASGQWTNITPPVAIDNSDQWYGFSGLSLDRQSPGTLMVTGYSSWWPDTIIYRSTNSGDSWTPFWTLEWPNLVKRYNLDITGAPWQTYGANPEPPEEAPKLGWMTQGLAIDPHNSNRFFFTGPTIFGSTNLTAIDTGGTVNLQVRAQGVEESAALGLIKPPGLPLVSALLDIGGFRHDSLTTVPSLMHQQPFFSNTTGIDFVEGNPSWQVRVGTGFREGQSGIGFSTNGGTNWFQGSPPGSPQGGSVAAGATPSGSQQQRFVWAPENASPLVITGLGNSWAQVQGLPQGAKVAADRVNPNRFYAYANGTVYVSTNGGQSFTAAATGLPTEEFVSIKAVPGLEGHVWFAGESGLLRSTNGGASFTNVGGSTWAYNVGFGAAAPGQTHPAVFAVATINGVRGLFRSDNVGSSWVRINDDQHQWGNMGGALTGDPDVFGRVYVGTNGRGILYGSPSGTISPSPSPPPSPPPPPPPAPTGLTVTGVSASSASLSWNASTGATSYQILRAPGASGGTFQQVGQVSGTSFTDSPLQSNATYRYRVTASNANGTSPPSNTVQVITSSGQTGGCTVTYNNTNQWPGGFQAEVTITDTSSSTVNGWSLAWTFTAGQQITQLWNGNQSQTGGNVTVTNAGWNGTIPPNQSVGFGFLANWSGSNPNPSAFTLNGNPCTVG